MNDIVLLIKKNCEAWITHETVMLKHYGENSVRRNFRTARTPSCEKFRAVKIPHDENSIRRKFLQQKSSHCEEPFILKQKQKRFLNRWINPVQYQFFFIPLETWKICLFQMYLRYWKKQAIVKLLEVFQHSQNFLCFFF